MNDYDVRRLAGRPGRVGGSAEDLFVPKLMRPLVRAGTVRRSSLIGRLEGSDACPVVSVTAPAGYGKTTLLAQWAERGGRAFAWVSVEEADNDPRVLLSYVAEALDAVEPVGQRVFDALASPASSLYGSVVPRLSNAFSSMISPVVLVLDDVHLLRDSGCRAALSVLAGHVPGGSRLVLAGRDEPPVRVARLRAEGKITEIGPAELSLTAEEAGSLLRAAGVVLAGDDLAALYRRTEGWPAGLYLAALSLREGGSLPGAAASFGGDDRFVSEYVESEFLARISSSQRVFLTRTAVLERMSGPLCEAVLEPARVRCGPGGAGPVEPAAGAAGPPGSVVPLSPPVPRHAPGGAGTPGAGPDPGTAAPRRRLVPAQRLARGGAGVLHGGRGRRCCRPPGGGPGAVGLPAGPDRDLPGGGSSGWPTGTRSRDGRSSQCGPRFSPGGRDGRLRPSGGRMPSIAGNTVTRRGPLTLAPRRGPPCCGPSWPGTGSSSCAPTLMRPREGSRRQASWCQRPPSCEGSHASFAAIPKAATFTSRSPSPVWRSPSPSGKAAHPMCWRTRCASGRWWRWHVTSGARPRPLPAARARSCAGPANRTLTPRCARCKPVSPCTGETSRRPARNSSLLNGSGLC